MGRREMPSRCALLAIDAGGRSILRLITPVGVLVSWSDKEVRQLRLRRESATRFLRTFRDHSF